MIDQGEMFDIANPCRGVCEVNNKGYCKGCLRKREERFHWNEFTSFQKQLIVNLCGRRRSKAIAARQQAEWLEKYGPLHVETEIPQLDMFILEDSQHDIESARSEAEASQQPEKNLHPQEHASQEQQTDLKPSEREQPQAEPHHTERTAPPTSLFDMPENNPPTADNRTKRRPQKKPLTQRPKVVGQHPDSDQFDLF